MTEQHPENIPSVEDFDPALVQYITVERDDVAAVFTEDGRVFYNLDSLFTQFALPLMARQMMAELSGDPEELARVEGAVFIVESIRQSSVALKNAEQGAREVSDLEAAFDLPDADEADYGFTGEDGDLS